MSGCNNRNHHHHHFDPQNEKRMLWAAIVTGLFMLFEVIGGVISGSLALLADAGHMLTDFASLLMAWFAFYMARRPADSTRTFGYERLQILAAFVNGVSLFFIAIWIVKEAIDRFFNPIAVESQLMMGVALVGFLINVIAFKILHGADNENLNVRGAIIHVLGDLLGSVAALIGGIIIYFKDWNIVDPILSILIACILLRSAWFVINESSHILLQNVPKEVDFDKLVKDCFEKFPIIQDIHHLHIWAITQERYILSMHVKLKKRATPEEVTCQIKDFLFKEYKIDHSTIEVEFELCADDMLPSLNTK
jgi:cobalt-zinc-cadmium efflux system protein